jgi:hypothetical protein
MTRFIFLFLVIASTQLVYSQTSSTEDTWRGIVSDLSIPQNQIKWLADSLSSDERETVLRKVLDISNPNSAQQLVKYFYTDGSYKRKSINKYIDSLLVRPPDGYAGIARTAYLVSKLRKKLVLIREEDSADGFYQHDFSNSPYTVPSYDKSLLNKNIKFQFDVEPASIFLDIIEQPDMTYKEIYKKINTKEINALIKHRNQSFYDDPLTIEKLIECLRIASSTASVDVLYKYINPDGLFYFTDVSDNKDEYRRMLLNIKTNEGEIFNYINAKISPLLPKNTAFTRKVSFFFINGSDGWTQDDITALDLNYYKDNIGKMLPLLAHESYHTAQEVVALASKQKYTENVKAFVDAIDYIYLEGTATYACPPTIKSKEKVDTISSEGAILLEKLYKNTIIKFDPVAATKNSDEGIINAGPFYWMGARMSEVIISELGVEKFINMIPYKGVAFFKLYFKAIEKSSKHKNMFSLELQDFIKKIE